jgi:hypothetical protein
LEVTPTLKTRSSTRLLVLNEVTQVAKTSRDLADPLQIWQIPFSCSHKIILSPVHVCFHDISMSVLQLWKRSLPAILAWKNHSMIGASYTVRPSKSEESRCINWARADPQWFGGWFFWRNCNRRRVIVPISIWIVGYVCEVAMWCHSKDEKINCRK